ncbi:type II toxin-antitoxin system VapB family antitoxin [Sphingomonas sp. CLY1604]|uniref:type II toxin-antitoxin system VapB family antitoxin n=1 Tax=Sphingomonas sp. CLY1604 TaxID=3457786 RepID=UPI003FD783EB
MASLYVKDEETNALAARLARRRGISKTAAVKQALQHELARDAANLPLRERMRIWREEHPLGEPTGLKADKAFYDSLNDEDDD